MTVFQAPSWQRGPARGSYGNVSKEDSVSRKNGARACRTSQFQFRFVYAYKNTMACVLAIEHSTLSTTEFIAFTESVLKQVLKEKTYSHVTKCHKRLQLHLHVEKKTCSYVVLKSRAHE